MIKSSLYPPFLQKLLESRPPAHQGVHQWLFRIARYLYAFHTEEEICKILEEKTADCGRALEPHEIRDAVQNSFHCRWIPWREDGKTAAKRRAEWLAAAAKRPRTPKFAPDQAIKMANRLTIDVSPDWIQARSPVPVDCSPRDYLEAIFQLHEKILIFHNYRSQGFLWPSDVDLDSFSKHLWPEGVWFLSNPIDGRYHFNPRRGESSRRSMESITAWRHFVLECDHEPREVWRPIWLKILAQLPLPIISITDSGGKSDHAIVRVPCTSKEEWDRYRDKDLKPLIALGACEGSLSAVRLTRLPQCFRGDRRQELLYLNPRADGTPIFQQEVF